MGSGSHWAVLRYPVAIIGGRRDVAVDVCDPAPVAFIVVIHREGWLDAIGDVGHDGEQSRPERRANVRRRGDEETRKHAQVGQRRRQRAPAKRNSRSRPSTIRDGHPPSPSPPEKDLCGKYLENIQKPNELGGDEQPSHEK